MHTLDRLRRHINDVPPLLRALPEQELSWHLPGKWSRKQVLGHLIDSAINNLKRFTDAQFANGPYPIQSYNQDKLVSANGYQDLPLSHLLTLWSSLNIQICYVIEAMSTTTLSSPIQLPATTQAGDKTLQWLFDDYVLHMEHHLKTLI
ncbi:DinB family protein [Spirosoma aerolatum]|uniref:DinB family protein n=1 Tax=Spirosoma aerolatum TaxID=1211326 RepID=UPI0009AE45C7|nr:DinB family protein [Spirosoma aerolatum]